MHEIGHVIGFWHEHARPDRDDYIEIKKENIQHGKDFNFVKMTWKDIDDKNISYDVGSVMHYSSLVSTFCKVLVQITYQTNTHYIYIYYMHV